MDNHWEKIQVSSHLQNSYKSHSQLCKLACAMKDSLSENIIIDFSKSEFIAANLFAVLGCILGECSLRCSSKKSVKAQSLRPSLCEVTQKNGFCQHINLNRIKDIHNTVIGYKIFGVSEIDEYERYLTISLFSRKDLPKMSKGVSDNIRDSLLEIFKNVIDHTSSKNIYTCGQYFPKSNILYFTVVDAGETIPYNVNKYHTSYSKTIPDCCLEWAVETGNTTLDTKSPRGIGLSIIRNFVKLNSGNFCIVSGNETYEISNNKERYRKFSDPFPGTFVTIGFNLSDKASYHMSFEEDTDIIF